MATKETPTTPVNVVAAVSSWRRPLSIASLIGRFSFVLGVVALYTAVHFQSEAAAPMSGISGWLRWISPWVALGLAGALAFVLLRPAAEEPAAQLAASPPAETQDESADRMEAPTTPPPSQFVSYADAVDATAPAVVNIYALNPFGRA